MKRKFWTSEKILSVSAVLISLCTLIVFTFQANLIRKQQYMSVYPHLSLHNYGSSTTDYKFKLTNNGIGPAFIKEVKIKAANGKSYRDIIDYVRDQITSADSVDFYHSNIFPGRLISEKESIYCIELIDGKMSSSHKLHSILNAKGLDILITYESIYGESWTITSGSHIPVKN